jgi:hypothetical protein
MPMIRMFATRLGPRFEADSTHDARASTYGGTVGQCMTEVKPAWLSTQGSLAAGSQGIATTKSGDRRGRHSGRSPQLRCQSTQLGRAPNNSSRSA